MKSVFSKTWQQLTSKIWSLPEVLATAVARVNIKPTTPFCTISQEISQWISTATGNNGSQLQQAVVTLDIPVASSPVLSVEMRKSLTLCCTLCPGSRFQSYNLHWPLSPTPTPQAAAGLTSLSPHCMKRMHWQAWTHEWRAMGTRRAPVKREWFLLCTEKLSST